VTRAWCGVIAGLSLAAVACTDDVKGEGVVSGDGATAPVDGPTQRPYSDQLAALLKVPAGFRVRPFATGLDGARMLAAGPGALYVTVPARGQVLRVADDDGDGDAADPGEVVVAADAATTPALKGVQGIAISGDAIYLAGTSHVVAGRLCGGLIEDLHEIGAALPLGGEHAARAIAVGPDGNLYLSVGSDCNACAEHDSEHGTLLRLAPDGVAADNPPNLKHPLLAQQPEAVVSARVFASGLRDMPGFDWHPLTGALWGADNGSDGLPPGSPPEEINLLAAGRSYGWPYCWADERVDPNVADPSRVMTKDAYCAGTMIPLSTLPAHSQPGGLVFYKGGQFPAPYVNDAFIALRGSRGDGPPTGFQVIRLHFIAGQPAAIPGTSSSVQEFLTGFLLDGGYSQFGRPAALAVDQLGALVVADEANGVIYRVTYEPEAVAPPPAVALPADVTPVSE
jgi:glucose/arabinose dehydrogenase